eukprot:TRINITY_DN1476_c0_g1_i1.p1 TRINITY_DN1476_c0_g1~~TRINITY_DN1476_c0_g1_i1.p1  ORF type:complete len:1076 (+),score=253.31 TRINITY_DN1476_c0_g1_i1:223-3450(+)
MSSHGSKRGAAALGIDEESGRPLLTQTPRSGGVRSSFKKAMEPFIVDDPKKEEPEKLAEWRKYALVLNYARRFRDLKKRVTGLDPLHRFRVGGLAIEAIRRFQQALPREETSSFRIAREAGFEIASIDLEGLVDKGDTHALEKFGGVHGLARKLQSDTKTGLCFAVPEDPTKLPEELTKRQEVYGPNSYPEKPPKGFFSFVFEAAQDVTLIILAVCAIISIAVGIPTEGLAEGWYDGGGIAFSVILVVVVTATSDYKQSLQFRELDAEKRKISIQVIRNDQRVKISVYDIVVGDVVVLSVGDILPTDGVLIEAHSMLVDDSNMTGESKPKRKAPDEDPFMQAGTKVQDGSGLMLTTGVGLHTQWGHLMEAITQSGQDETPLQVRLSGVATLVGNLGLVVATVVFIVLIVRYFFSTGGGWEEGTLLQLVRYFAIAVTIIVVAVPEGLPLAVTLTLAFAMKRMMADQALVRKLAACETMGSATTICSDKTGTLTTNRMTVVTAFMGGKTFADVDNIHKSISPTVVELALENIFQNTTGDVDPAGNIIGSPTETAILRLAGLMGGNFKATRGLTKVVAVDPFNSKRKRMGVVVRLPNGVYRAHWKGAAEIILGMCDKIVDQSGRVSPVDSYTIGGVIDTFAHQALRTLSIAYKDLDRSELPPQWQRSNNHAEWPSEHGLPLTGFTMIGIVGIKDPLRDGVKESVGLCQSAGIKVRMVTGDNLVTAKAIASECGILTDGEAIEGPVFRTLSIEAMRTLIPKLQVMARSSPSDKLTLVKELRAMGEVVAVTGDGTNDAPALKESDIGLAMGIAGTEVAKESADIVILDDNFATIVQVAKWGRSVYTNIQKFVQFQLTVNIVALVINFVSACVTGDAPLTAVQLLWVNLIMDTLGALALATDPPDDALMKKKPVGRKGAFITPVMWRNVAGMAIFQLTVLGVLQYKGLELLGLEGENAIITLNTLIFNTFVFCQVFNELNSRDMDRINVFNNLINNQLFLGVIAVTVVFQIILVQFLGKFASTVPLSLAQWGFCVGIGALSVPLAVLVKFIPVGFLAGAASKSEPKEGHDGYMPVPDAPSS